MKKLLTSFMFAAVMIVPGAAFAQTADQPATNADVAVQIDALKQQLILLLTQEVAALQAQLNDQLNQIHDIKKVMTDTAPVEASNTGASDVAEARAKAGPISSSVAVMNGHNHVFVGYLSTDTVSVAAFEGSKNDAHDIVKGAEVDPIADPVQGCNNISGSTIQSCGQNIDFPHTAGHFLVVEITVNGNTETKLVGDNV